MAHSLRRGPSSALARASGPKPPAPDRGDTGHRDRRGAPLHRPLEQFARVPRQGPGGAYATPWVGPAHEMGDDKHPDDTRLHGHAHQRDLDRPDAATQIPRVPPGLSARPGLLARTTSEVGGTFEPLDTFRFKPPNTLIREALSFNFGDPTEPVREALDQGFAHDEGETQLDGRTVRRIRIDAPPRGEPTYVYVDPATHYPVEIRGAGYYAAPGTTPVKEADIVMRFLVFEHLPPTGANLALTNIRAQHPNATELPPPPAHTATCPVESPLLPRVAETARHPARARWSCSASWRAHSRYPWARLLRRSPTTLGGRHEQEGINCRDRSDRGDSWPRRVRSQPRLLTTTARQTSLSDRGS